MEYFDRNGKPLQMMEWAKLFGEDDYKRIAKTDLPGHVQVSTVWLGLNHSWDEGLPLIFETMVFGGEHDGWMTRYSTEESARRGHVRVVTLLEKGEELDEQPDAQG